MRIDLNCDMGESFGSYSIGNDESVMRSITSANIACGFIASCRLKVMQAKATCAKLLGLWSLRT